MILLNALEFSLPLKNPVVIFSLVLFIILFAPILFSKIKVPHIIGLIIAGVIVGPYALNLLKRDSSIVLFGTVGLLYIMFLAGLEIDLGEFKKNKNKIAVFGLTTFILPLVFGCLASYYILNYSFLASVLLASMFSTHTLISYPIASRYGVTRNRAVSLTIGGTMITDILALLILAAISGITKEQASVAFWVQLVLSSLVFAAVVFLLFPIITRWFFKKFDDSVSQYIFILAMVFLASFLAEAAGLESIIGAFFAGLVLNKFVPHSSPLMNRIDFVGNALFIPFFLLSVGMLVDVSVLIKGFGALKVAGVIIVVAVATKYLAAVITQKAFKLTNAEGKMIFGLSTSHAAATLAIILVGYNIIIGETVNGEPIRLLNEDVLNGTILLILVSCAISSFVVEKASKGLALQEEIISASEGSGEEKILISLAYPETINSLIDFGLMLKPKKSEVPVYALHITDDESGQNVKVNQKKILDQAIQHASATENTLLPLTRFDVNISNGIIYTIKEHNITDVLIGMHHKINEHSFFGPKAEEILNKILDTIFIYRSMQPLNTLKRMVIVIPAFAEEEPGFMNWLNKLLHISKELGMPLVFYATEITTNEIKGILEGRGNSTKTMFYKFDNWDDFLIISREVKLNDLFVIISSRVGQPSYTTALTKIPYYVLNYFENNNLVIVYPKQVDLTLNLIDLQEDDLQLVETKSKRSRLAKVGRLLGRLFKS
jgi:Kef-type K+ transport system membrane component KefB